MHGDLEQEESIVVAQRQEQNILRGISASFTKRKIQRCQRRLGNGRDVELHVTVADLYNHLGDARLAIESFHSAIKSLLYTGTPLNAANSDQLIHIYRRILALDPLNCEIALKLGQEYLRRGFQYRAIELHSTLAERYAKKGDYQKATEHYQQIFTIESGSITARIACAKLYEKMDAPDQAAEEYSHIGDIYFEHQRFDGALEYYQQAAALDPDDTDIEQKVHTTQQVLDGTLIPQAQASLQKLTILNQDQSRLKRSLAKKEQIEQELRSNIHVLKQRYAQSEVQKNQQLRATKTRLEELSTYVAVFKDNLEQVTLEKQSLQEQLEQELRYKQDLEGKLAKLSSLVASDRKDKPSESSQPSPSSLPDQTQRLESAVIRLHEGKVRLEKQLHEKLQQTSQRERRLREHLQQQNSRGTTLERQLSEATQEQQQVERQLQQQLQNSLHREQSLRKQMKRLIVQHEQILEQVEREKQETEEKYRATQAQMSAVETTTMTTLEQVHGELSLQYDLESDFSEQFHESLQEISRLLYTQEQEISQLEQL
ncbi:hypothetical protein CSA56_03430 [candidate division KSB3 bacterium]|uniref:MalT-like TPR region domain-containing protein n=1 Tax=candidate division KSB3 bacterium TaxID=2044937 RepID=A0A2G6KIY9_9BACT|nr:MAG: hypothetical protein CSA56_03430 [candidate division KSB3 bacterium]